MEIDLGDVFAQDLDLAHLRHPQTALVAHPHVRDAHRVKTHQFGRHRIDGQLVFRGQNQILAVRYHRARSGPVTGHGAVHHGQHPGMELLLHEHQVDQDFVHILVSVMAHFLEQPPERVLDRAGRRRMAVRLDRRKMDDLLADVHLRYLDSLGEDLV